MNIHLENINLNSTSGPNQFAGKLIKYLKKTNVLFNLDQDPDARLCFIESHLSHTDNIPLFQRLDGIYFNSAQDYKLQNLNIKNTYDRTSGVIFQSHFNKPQTNILMF